MRRARACVHYENKRENSKEIEIKMFCMCERDVLLLCKLIVYKTADITMPVKEDERARISFVPFGQ